MMQEMFLAVLVNKSTQWSQWYLNWREFGHRSLFGEDCMSDMTDIQSRLVSMTHLYDVIKSDISIEQDIPERLKPFPHELSKWYAELRKKLKEQRELEKREREDEARRNKSGGKSSKKGSSVPSTRPRTIYRESDGEAFVAMRKGQQEREAGKQ